VSMVKFSICGGTIPMNLFVDHHKICSCLHLNKVEGIVPVK
jgi:hypothetical protein